MLTGLYCIQDIPAKLYRFPMFHRNDGLATRMFATTVNDTEGEICKSPADFVLIKVGDFDDEKGIFIPERIPKIIVGGLALVKPRGPELFDQSTGH